MTGLHAPLHPAAGAGERIVLGEEEVQKSVGDLLTKTDLSRFVL